MIVYEEIEPIRKTSKSYVALAVVEGYSQPMILKKLDCTNTALYEQLTNIQNEHIARIYEIEERNGSLLLVEEYVDGFPLNEYVQKMGLSNDEIIDLMLQLCDGLQTLHHADPPIIHRDLKPGNILVSEQGVLKIIDFDASRSYKPEHSHDTVIMGTAEYASPEQYGFAQTDVRSDIYSFGAILYELLFQQTLPRNSSTNNAIDQAPTKEFIKHTAKRQPDSLHELKNDRQTSALLQIINRCTMFDPNERFSSVEELARALRHDHTKQPSRHIGHIVLGTLVVIAVAVSALFGATKSGLLTPKKTKQNISTPTATPYNGPVQEIHLQDNNEANGIVEDAAYYYYKPDSSMTPIHVYCEDTKDLTPTGIAIAEENSYGARELKPKDWSCDDNGFVTLKDSYLQTLTIGTTYHARIDYQSAVVCFDIRVIDSLSSVTTQSRISLVPENITFYTDQPKDLKVKLSNTFGRKIKRIMDLGFSEEVPWSMDDDGTITIDKSAFQHHLDGEHFPLQFEYNANLSLAEDDYSYLYFTMEDKPHVSPNLEKSNYLLTSSDLCDLKIPFQQNDARESITKLTKQPIDSQTNTEDIPTKYYEVTDGYLCISKEYLQTLGNKKYFLTIECKNGETHSFSIAISD